MNFLFPFSFVRNNPKTVMNENWNGFPIPPIQAYKAHYSDHSAHKQATAYCTESSSKISRIQQTPIEIKTATPGEEDEQNGELWEVGTVLSAGFIIGGIEPNDSNWSVQQKKS